MFKATAITLIPEAWPGPLGASILGRARAEGIWDLETVDLRTFGLGKHRKVDDTPAGGGAGLVLRPDVAAAAVDSVQKCPDLSRSVPAMTRPVVYLSPRGRRFDQEMARQWAAGPGVILFCGRFEGLDERAIEARDMQEVSLGDFVLAGGDVAAMAMLEAAIRLLPGVAGNSASITGESFENGLLEYPHYTLPREWEGRQTPPVLLSGDHRRIEEWRISRSKALTFDRRPDLYAAYSETPTPTAPETGDEPD
ncbi:tRNA (guanine-N1)-methyltransferase [Hyphomonas neptunium ATCC 15444]|uniref:tRNA (guanine-N(1)-)-methyltransferase n=2 Tax=Hyphomonas TaxID=85 RepID=Q0C664_HYPNA|nr:MULTISPECIES: tRNA (guanosine(37)-N1)-methyltransferase TrmD [Hyphomonas]ABI76092.1 tRNA (guanine-N1)-methyltransferase [Hyphomonas neptunium ATCC 15444]KCZ94859.1 tRNA (guanine-N1)-methyltransferase [Hyphomonas hirschiana VP5]